MNRKQPFTFEEFKDIYSKVPRLCVDLVIQTEDGILLTLREKNGYVGQWHLPGGTVFYRESSESAIQRVAKEELNVEVSVIKLLGYIEYFSEVEKRGFGYAVSLAFLCKLESSDIKLDDQASKSQFFKVIPENTVTEQKAFFEKLQMPS